MPATARLVAEDEEETLRRLASYRQVTDDFIAKGGGRIFNTAGDAVLAEFPSAVEAVRCAIDIQESLRTRNMAYPPSRQMAFRIGITIGDVVERDGDLLGDGVNIAARLEGLAEVGGICISRAVHEQVANKLSVQFADIGAQEVKNIPTPVHAYMVAMRREDGTYATPQVKKPAKAQGAAQPNWMWPVAVTVVSLAAIGVGGFLYFTKLETSAPQGRRRQQHREPGAVGRRGASADACSSGNGCRAGSRRTPAPLQGCGACAVRIADGRIVRKIRRRQHSLHRRQGPRHARFGLRAGCRFQGVLAQYRRVQRFRHRASRARRLRNRPRSSNARSAPMPRSRRANANSTRSATPSFTRTASRRCRRCPGSGMTPSTEQPFVAKNVPLTRDGGKTRLETVYAPARKNKALALGPGGALFFPIALDTVEEAVRRALESCGGIAGVPCMIVALNDNFVVPIPASLKVTGFFKAAGNTMIAADARDDVARRLADASSGWNAVAVGAAGRPGLGLKAATEQAAVNAALAECVKRDSNCQVIAIGPFSVGPN